MDAPMLPATPAITWCHACKAPYWVADAPVLAELYDDGRRGEGPAPDAETLERWRSAPEVRHPTRAQLFRALESGLADTEERERLLRTLAWHASNHPRRRGRAKPSSLEPKELQNMERLFELERRTLYDAALNAAELARELGRWELVPGFLKVPFPERFEEVGRRIAALAEARDSQVARVP